MYITIILSCALHFASTWATPIASPEDLVPRTFLEQRQVHNFNDLTKEFRGIDWSRAFDTEDCNDVQLDKVVKATRNAVMMLQRVDKLTDGVLGYSEAWKAYFGYDLSLWQTDQKLRNQAVTLRNNIQIAMRYPKYGKNGPKGDKKRWKVTFTCKLKEKCFKDAGMVAIKPGGTDDDQGRIVFCPDFFDPKTKTLDEVLQKPRPANDIWMLGRLAERLVIHEFMHVEKFGYSEYITDLRSTLSDKETVKLPVYGESTYYDFAKKYKAKPNADVLLNADNYSWFFIYSYFDDKWGWTASGQGRDGPLRPRSLDNTISPRDGKGKQAADEVIPDAPTTDADAVEPSGDLPKGCKILDQKDSHGVNKFECDPKAQDDLEVECYPKGTEWYNANDFSDRDRWIDALCRKSQDFPKFKFEGKAKDKTVCINMAGGGRGIYSVFNDRDRTDTVQPDYCYEMLKKVAQCLRGGQVLDEETGWLFQAFPRKDRC